MTQHPSINPFIIFNANPQSSLLSEMDVLYNIPATEPCDDCLVEFTENHRMLLYPFYIALKCMFGKGFYAKIKTTEDGHHSKRSMEQSSVSTKADCCQDCRAFFVSGRLHASQTMSVNRKKRERSPSFKHGRLSHHCLMP